MREARVDDAFQDPGPKQIYRGALPVSLPIQMVLKSPVGIGRHMPRDRHQVGWLHRSPYKRAKWYGEYFIYRRNRAGEEVRIHRTAILGLCSEVKRSEAAKELQRLIEAESGAAKRGDYSVTFAWFAKNRYLAMHGPALKDSSREVIEWLLDHHLIPEFGELALADMDRFRMQSYLKRLADAGRSSSFIHKARTYLKAILEEAVDHEYISRNQANLLEAPRVAEKPKRYLKPEECKRLIGAAHGRDRLILELFIFCALRPGELFALRWDDWEPGLLRVDESVRNGKIDTPKTLGSLGYAALPTSVELQLKHWKEQCRDAGPRAFIFAGRARQPIMRWDWDKQVLKRIAADAGIDGVTFQALRRTTTTLMQKVGTAKDVQSQMRHSSPVLTIGTYMQAIPASVKEAVELLDRMIQSSGNEREVNENGQQNDANSSSEPSLIQ